ncbi:MBL fold metallo-hydrolase [Candidatus Aerophobetes bacterium]|nr:MBL fold metallo-hydrolase [Candidatus Aerophobetes bacterium]
MEVNITWLGHASFKIEGKGKVIYIDPWKIKEKEKADIVLVTHSHYDHFSLEDIEKIRSDKTCFIAPSDVAVKLKGNVKKAKSGDEFSLEDVSVKAFPAYNVGKPYHPRANGWVGYVVEIEGVSIYHPGDTDFIPEMKDIKPYVALLPIGGTYTMGVEDALKAVDVLSPRIVIPMHYGEIVGSVDDAKRFSQKCKVEVKILTKGEKFKVELTE